MTRVKVYPDIRQIGRYTLLARRDKLSAIGVRRSRRLGTDNEFERLRDYADGDEPRHLDWKATARRRKLTVRAHQANQSQRIIFLIDCGRMMAGDTGGGLSPLDHAFNAMLMLAHVALLRGDQVGLLAYSDRIRAYVPPGGGPTRINRLVHAVHDVFPELVEPRHDRAFVELERRCRKRSLVVLMTNVFDDVNARQVGDHLGNVVGRHLPLGVFLRDHDLFALADDAPDAGPGLYAGAVAASMLTWREQVLAGLRLKGALTLDVFPDDLTAPLDQPVPPDQGPPPALIREPAMNISRFSIRKLMMLVAAAAWFSWLAASILRVQGIGIVMAYFTVLAGIAVAPWSATRGRRRLAGWAFAASATAECVAMAAMGIFTLHFYFVVYKMMISMLLLPIAAGCGVAWARLATAPRAERRSPRFAAWSLVALMLVVPASMIFSRWPMKAAFLVSPRPRTPGRPGRGGAAAHPAGMGGAVPGP